MNIFVLDADPVAAAKAHCDCHVVKMILETTQILCGVHHRFGSTFEGIYKPTHLQHPCVLWAASTLGNYNWLCELLVALQDEYAHRYGKMQSGMSAAMHVLSGGKAHKSMELLDHLKRRPPAKLLRTMAQLQPHVFVGPAELAVEGDVVASYRALYHDKAKTMKRPMRWTRRTPPSWLDVKLRYNGTWTVEK